MQSCLNDVERTNSFVQLATALQQRANSIPLRIQADLVKQVLEAYIEMSQDSPKMDAVETALKLQRHELTENNVEILAQWIATSNDSYPLVLNLWYAFIQDMIYRNLRLKHLAAMFFQNRFRDS